MTGFFTSIAVRFRTAGTGVSEREDGQTMVEYALLIAFIAVVVLAGVVFLGDNILALFDDTASSLSPN